MQALQLKWFAAEEGAQHSSEGGGAAPGGEAYRPRVQFTMRARASQGLLWHSSLSWDSSHSSGGRHSTEAANIATYSSHGGSLAGIGPLQVRFDTQGGHSSLSILPYNGA